MPSKSLPNGSAGAFFFFFEAAAFLSRADSAAPASPDGPYSSRSRCFFGRRPNGTPSAMPKVADNDSSASAISFLSPRAQGAMAPSASDFEGSGTTRAGSKSQIAPSPWQAGHAP